MFSYFSQWIWTVGRYLIHSLFIIFPSALALLYWNQRFLIYPAHVPNGSRQNVWTPNEFGFPADTWKTVELKTQDDVLLQAYVISAKSTVSALRSRAAKGSLTILYLHANAGNMGHRLPIAKAMYDVMQGECHIFMLSYRGYGKSQGSPSEAGMKLDAKTALNYILDDVDMGKKHNPKNKIVVYGQSIGGAVAIDLCANHPDVLDGLMIENTFTSIPKLIPTVFPILKYLIFLCTEKWPSETQMHRLRDIHILFLSGSKDELVPQEHMKTLYDLSKSSDRIRRWAEFKDGTHNDTFMQPNYFTQVLQFLTETLEQ